MYQLHRQHAKAYWVLADSSRPVENIALLQWKVSRLSQML